MKLRYRGTIWIGVSAYQNQKQTNSLRFSSEKGVPELSETPLAWGRLRELVPRAAVATATTTTAIFAWLGLVDVQRASAQIRSVELLDRRSAFFLGRHFDE